MKIWIIYSKLILEPNKTNAMPWMLEEAKLVGFDAQVIYAENITIKISSSTLKIYHNNIEIELPDIAFMRCYDIPLIRQLELLGVTTFNKSYALDNCLDKWTTHQLLAKNNISTPDTIYSRFYKSYEDISVHFGNKFIVKELRGSKGDNVFLVDDEDSFNHAITSCISPLFQEYIDTSYGKDIRVHVIDNQVVATVLRVSDNDFKSNFSQGGRAESYDADERVKQLAIESAKALGLEFAGIDILFTDDDYTVCEVNGVPGFRTVGLTSDISIPRKMFKYIRKNVIGE